MAAAPVLEVRDVSMAFSRAGGAPLEVLSHITLSLQAGEIVGLLGRSGSGKSTLLRLIAGLLRPTSGEVVFEGRPVTNPPAHLAMVFQTFALFPWLSVLQNVEVGLDALGIPQELTRKKASEAIKMIGLDGFESAFPRELSGGMRQRVGFARALVIEPLLMLMDEPFSALDVLTAETLRTDFLDLWQSGHMPTRAVLLVTHNIEEAVLFCDRIFVLAPNPGRIATEVAVGLPQPRERQDPAFHGGVDCLYAALTARGRAEAGAGAATDVLPSVTLAAMTRLLETVARPPWSGEAALADLTARRVLHPGDVLAAADALERLGFAELKEGRIRLTAAAGVFVQGEREERKRLFREHLLRFVPLAAHMHAILRERKTHRAPRTRFESELEDRLTRPDAQRTLETLTAWGRYADLFAFDARTRDFKLPAE